MEGESCAQTPNSVLRGRVMVREAQDDERRHGERNVVSDIHPDSPWRRLYY